MLRPFSAAAVGSDLLAAVLASGLTVLYLLFAAAPTGSAELDHRNLPVVPPAPAAGGSVAAPIPAPWVAAGEPVPAEALYTLANPAPWPAHEAKPRSWYNRILFPAKHCPYCGRRVPTEKGSYWFLLLGFIGQFVFSLRFLVQWLASEKAGDSVVPVSFWWLSIFGSLFLLIYAIAIMAWPIILGQAPNCFIYARNLYFIKRRSQEAAAAAK